MQVEITSQQEFIAHAVLLGYENRGMTRGSKGAFLLVHRHLPMVSVGNRDAFFLSTVVAGEFYDLQAGFDYILTCARYDGGGTAGVDADDGVQAHKA